MVEGKGVMNQSTWYTEGTTALSTQRTVEVRGEEEWRIPRELRAGFHKDQGREEGEEMAWRAREPSSMHMIPSDDSDDSDDSDELRFWATKHVICIAQLPRPNHCFHQPLWRLRSLVCFLTRPWPRRSWALLPTLIRAIPGRGGVRACGSESSCACCRLVRRWAVAAHLDGRTEL